MGLKSTPKVQMADRLVECVKLSVIDTFAGICGSSPEYGEGLTEQKPCSGIVGIISFVGDIVWTAMLGFPKETAESIATTFVGFEIEFESDDMRDLVGELSNILAGDLVARFDTEGIAIGMSLPSMARGSDIEVLLPGRFENRKLFFNSKEGDFWLNIASAKQVKRRLDGKIPSFAPRNSYPPGK